MGSNVSKSTRHIKVVPLAETYPDLKKRKPKTPSLSERSSTGSSMSEFENVDSPPLPRPPLSKKANTFVPSLYKDVDRHALKTPQQYYLGGFNSLVKYLIGKPCWDDMSKLRAIFIWITSIDVYNLKQEEIPPTHSPLEYLVKIQLNMGNHAHLFTGLCQLAGIHCVIISGMNKSAAYEVSKKVDREAMGAQWNAVYVDGSWRLIDTFWASSCVVGRKSGEWSVMDIDGVLADTNDEETEGITRHKVNEFYFLTDPDYLIWTHYPDEHQWQLLKKPVSQREFEEHFYVRERFYYLGMGMRENTLDKCLVTTENGELNLEFSLPPLKSENYKFKYMLHQSRKQAGTDRKVNVLLDRFVFYEKTAGILHFNMRFPIRGTFKMDIYGLNSKETDIFDLTCTYVILCPVAKNDCLPLPAMPALGWGPGPESVKVGIKPISHKRAVIETTDGNIDIKMAIEKDVTVSHKLSHATIDEATLSKYALTKTEGGEATVRVRLPEYGEFGLEIFTQRDSEDEAFSACSYLIKCDNKNIGNIPFPNVPDGRLGKNYRSEKLHVEPVSHKGGVIDMADGRAVVTFKTAKTINLLCELHTIDGKSYLVNAKPREDSGLWEFYLDLPYAGEYTLNIFAREEGENQIIYNVHTYLIDSKGRKDKLIADNETSKLTILTESVETSDKEVIIPVAGDYNDVVAAIHKINGRDATQFDQITFTKRGDKNHVVASLPELGDYVLNLYNLESLGVIKNIAKYQISRKRPSELFQTNIENIIDSLVDETPEAYSDKQAVQAYMSVQKSSTPRHNSAKPKKTEADAKRTAAKIAEEKRKQARTQLLRAMDIRDIRHLQKAIEEFQASGASDEELVRDSNRLMVLLQAKHELIESCRYRPVRHDSLEGEDNIKPT